MSKYLISFHDINIEADLPQIDLHEGETTTETREDKTKEEASNQDSGISLSNIFIGVIIIAAIAAVISGTIFAVRFLKNKKQNKKEINIDKEPTTNKKPKHNNIHSHRVTPVEPETRAGSGSIEFTRMLWKIAVRLEDANTGIIYESCFDSTEDYGCIKVGRGDRHQVDIKIPFQNISDEHCEILKKGKLYYLRDLNSTNGTKYDGVKVMGTVPLREEGIISLGSRSFNLKIADK